MAYLVLRLPYRAYLLSNVEAILLKKYIMKVLRIVIPVLLLLVLLCLPDIANAQCPMCRMTAESNLANGGNEGQGLNNGILYMLLTPYVLIGVIAFVWRRNRKSEKELELEA